ncbi:MAG: LacI family DNA-binding transcriptional regulator [Lentisphaeria bacterium]|nr:LacI family DNA-binding transcriptional regulator [Lentisphaeria bacterium]
MAATLKMVAEKAGVSIRTAGRALSGSGPVKSEVAKRVQAAARELQYVPNAAARSLKQQASRIVGVISGRSFQSECSQRRIRLLEGAFREAGHHTLLGALPESQDELFELLRSWTGIVESVIFLAWPPAWNAEKLHALPIRFLFIDCELVYAGFERIETDRTSGVAAAVTELIRAGRRRIARVGTDGAAGRRAGFELALSRAEADVASIFIGSSGLEFADGFAAGRELEAFRADAVFFDTDRMALGFYRYASENGIPIPASVAVAGFDDDAAGAFAIPALTTVAHPDAETVKHAVEKVLSPAAGKPELIVYPARLVRRESI